MNLTNYLRILVRRGWIVVLAIILTAGSAYAFSKVQTPIYRATQKILLKPARNDFGLQQTMKQLISSYAARLDTNLQGQEVLPPHPGQAPPTALPYSSRRRLSSPSDRGAAPRSAWLGAAPAGGGGPRGGTPAPRRRGMLGRAAASGAKVV